LRATLSACDWLKKEAMANYGGCKFKIFAARPAAGGGLPKLGGDDDPTGHTFVSLTSENGSEEFYGFYPKGAIVGWDNVDPKDRIEGPKDFFKPVQGTLNDDRNHLYTDLAEYDITPEQAQDMKRFVQKWQESEPKYTLATHNCSTFAMKVARAGGISPPTQLSIFDSPASIGPAIARRNSWAQLIQQFDSAVKRIYELFRPGDPEDAVERCPINTDKTD